MDEQTAAKVAGIAKKLLVDSAREDELVAELAGINRAKRRMLADLELILRDKSLDRFSGIEDVRASRAGYKNQ